MTVKLAPVGITNPPNISNSPVPIVADAFGFMVRVFNDLVARDVCVKFSVPAWSATTIFDVDEPVIVPVPFTALFSVSVLPFKLIELVPLIVSGPTVVFPTGKIG